MFPAGTIFRNIYILKVSFRNSEVYTCTSIKCRCTGKTLTAVPQSEATGQASPLSEVDGQTVLVAYTGYGIIDKPRNELPPALLEKLSGKDTEFIWNEDSSGVVSLLRDERTAAFREEIAKTKAAVIGEVACPDGTDDVLLEICRRFLESTLTVKRILKPDEVGSKLCSIIFNRTKLAVLGLLLALLVVNYFRGERAQAEYSAIRMELQTRERLLGAAGESDRQRNELAEKYERQLPHGYSWICDRIAIVLPESILLSSLKIQPSARKIENGKEIILNERKVEITGVASDTEDIMFYISALNKLQFTREVKMVSLEQERNSTDLLFNLMLTL